MTSESPEPARISRAEAILLAVMTLAGGLLRFHNLGTKSLWYDEAVIYHLVQGGWREILTQNALENSAPPLYALLLGLLTGPDASEAALRALSALAGTAAIPLVYLLARQFIGPRVAWLAPALFAVAPVQIIYAQQLREYSMTTAVAAFMLLAFTRFVRWPGRREAALVAAAAVLGLLTQYGLGLLLTALNLVCLGAFLLARQPPASYRHWFVSQLPAAAVAVLLYFTVIRQQMPVVNVASVGYLAPYYWSAGQSLLEFVISPRQDIVAFAFPGLPMLLLWAVGLQAFIFGARSALATAFCLAPIALGIAAAMAGAYPYGAIRQDIYLTPMIYVCAALGADRLLAILPARLPRFIPMGVLGILSLLVALPGIGGSRAFLAQPVGYEPMRLVAQALKGELYQDRHRKIYVYYGAIPAFRYYWRDQDVPWIPGTFHQSFMDEEKSRGQMLTVQAELNALTAGGQPYWVVISHMETADENWLLESLERSAEVRILESGSSSGLLLVTPRGAGVVPRPGLEAAPGAGKWP